MRFPRNYRFSMFLLLFAVFLLHSVPHVRAQQTVLRVAFSSMPPWKTLEKERVGGIDIELLRMLAERMGLEVEFVHAPFARCLLMLEHGQADMMTGVLYSHQRGVYLHYLQPPVRTHSNKAFYVRTGSGTTVDEYEDLYGLRVGTNIKVKYFPRFDRDKQLIKDPAPKNFMINLRKLLNERVHVLVATEIMADYYVAKYGFADRISKCEYLYTRPNQVHMVLSRASPLASRLDEFNRHLTALLREGAADRIRQEFFSLLKASAPGE